MRVAALAKWSENTLALAALVAMAVLPVSEIFLRAVFKTGVPGSTALVQNLTLWVGFVGAMIATREGTHLKLAAASALVPSWAERIAANASAMISSAVAVGLCWASAQFMVAEMDSAVRIGGILPVWVIITVLPFSFAIIALRFIDSAGRWADRRIVLGGLLAISVLVLIFNLNVSLFVWPAMVALLLAAFIGVPIFVIIGGLALVFFAADEVTVAAIPVEAYRIVVSPSIPTIPLFVLTGYLIAEGNSGERLVRLFRALFGWMPGGLAVAVALVCAFMSTFTGASGVTILALGGVLLPVLVNNGYPERFSLGLVTASGSIGLLFPPSLAVILYGVIAHVPITDLFKAGIGPGLVMVVAVATLGIVTGLRSNAPRPPFALREAVAAIWQAKWEIGVPVIAIGGIFGGMTTLTEAAAITAVYAFVVQSFIHRDIHPIRDLPPVLLKCVTLIGSVFVILGVAMGLTNYIVDAEIPAKAVAWVEVHVHSRVLFLLALNIFLLLVGCLMDIYSATMVVVPLIVPISRLFGIDPLHLGMIFLVNLQLGYLTPPVGMNLFLAAVRFERPLPEICRAVLPFLLILIAVVVLVTYVPGLSLMFVR